MNTSIIRTLVTGSVVSWLGLSALGQAPTIDFNSGSNGSLGDVVIDTDTTIILPADGILHYKSFQVLKEVAVGFVKNANNTPVYLLSQGDVVIKGRIYISGGGSAGDRGPGLGGPGGFDGGRRGVDALPPGDGQGPGGGRAGNHSGSNTEGSAGNGNFINLHGNGSTNIGAVYGNAALIPLIGGSGGGGTPGYGGGGGGGAILIASNTRIFLDGASDGNHFIDATGGEWGTSGAYNGGSGGAVKLVAPVITGGIRIYVGNRNGTGGPGRIRLDAVNYSGANFGLHSPPLSLSYGSMLATGLEGTLPRLELVSVAGRPLPAGNVATGFILLPSGSEGDQPVVVRARNFGTKVPINVVLMPDNGPTVKFPAVIDNIAANPATATITVNVPANTPVKVHAWTR
jgi:hypothetical protein